MKLTTLFTAASSFAVGYVLGSAAGQTRYQQITTAAHNLANNPKLQEVLFDLAGQARTNSRRLPHQVADVVDKAATAVQDKLTHPADTAVVDTATVDADPTLTVVTASGT